MLEQSLSIRDPGVGRVQRGRPVTPQFAGQRTPQDEQDDSFHGNEFASAPHTTTPLHKTPRKPVKATGAAKGQAAREVLSKFSREKAAANASDQEDEEPKALLYPDVPWGDGPFPGCLLSSRILQILDWSLLLSCLYVGGTVPYLVGFGMCMSICWSAGGWYWGLAVDACVL